MAAKVSERPVQLLKSFFKASANAARSGVDFVSEVVKDMVSIENPSGSLEKKEVRQVLQSSQVISNKPARSVRSKCQNNPLTDLEQKFLEAVKENTLSGVGGFLEKTSELSFNCIKTALFLAIKENKQDICDVLLRAYSSQKLQMLWDSCIEKGQKDFVKTLINNDESVNRLSTVMNFSSTELMDAGCYFAIEKEQLEVVKIFLDSNKLSESCRDKAQSFYNECVQQRLDNRLISAVEQRSATTVQQLLKGDNSNVGEEVLKRAVDVAISNNDLSTIRALLTAKVYSEDFLQDVVCKAVEHRNIGVINSTIEAAKPFFKKGGSHGMDALQVLLVNLAAQEEESTIKNALLAQISLEDLEKICIVAAKNGNEGILNLLLTNERGGGFSSECLAKALSLAAANGKEAIVTMLLVASKVNKLSQQAFDQACMSAVKASSKTIATQLAQRKDACSQNGLLEACICAAQSGQKELAQTLLKEVQLDTFKNESINVSSVVLIVAVECKSLEIVKALLERKKKNFLLDDLKSAFNLAINKGASQMALHLLEVILCDSDDSVESIDGFLKNLPEDKRNEILAVAATNFSFATVKVLLSAHNASEENLRQAFVAATKVGPEVVFTKNQVWTILTLLQRFTPSTKDLENISPNNLGELLTKAVEAGLVPVVKTLLKDEGLAGTMAGQGVLGQACKVLEDHWNTELADVFLEFRLLSDSELRKLYFGAAKNRDIATLKKIAGSRYHFITIGVIEKSFQEAMERKYLEIVEELLRPLSAKNISDTLIELAGTYGCVNLINKRQEQRPLPNSNVMGSALSSAVVHGHKGVVKALLNCENATVGASLFDRDNYYEISPEVKTRALKLTSDESIQKILRDSMTWSSAIARFFMSISWDRFKAQFFRLFGYTQ